MTQWTYRREAGRPFGTVAALFCGMLTIALIALARVAVWRTGAASPVDADPALLPAMHPLWGLLLAGEIVHVVAGGTLLVAVWTLARPIGPRTWRNLLALLAGTLAGLLMIVAGRQGIVAAAHLGKPEILPYMDLVSAAGRASVACVGLWAALLALEARASGTLPRWVVDTGLVLGATALVAAIFPPLTLLVAAVSLAWWFGLATTLFRPADPLR